MRSFLACLVFFYCVNVIHANSQDNPIRRSSTFVELSAGPTTTTFYGPHIDNRLDSYYSPDAYIKERKGFVVNILIKYTFGKYFFTRSGLSYIQKGGEEINSRFKYAFKGDLNYLSIPLIIGFQPINFDNVRNLNLYVESGIVANFWVSRNNDTLELGYSYTPDLPRETLSYQLAAGIEFAITKRIAVSGKYVYFKDVTPFFEFADKKAFHKGSFFTGGVMYKLSKGID